MSEMHAQTKLTPQSVAMKTGFLDWGSQPAMFKRYPSFLFRYKAEDIPALSWLFRARQITSTHTIGSAPYHRLNVPSAGNLHPLELYVQIRGVKGVLSGVYHLDVPNEELVLIRDLEKDGVEPCLGIERRLRGIIVMVSLVPFRSYWKYGLRSWRYLFLDAGHQLATIAAIAEEEGQELTLLSDFDQERLGQVMGFEGKEAITAVIHAAEPIERKVEPITPALMHVLPTDYHEEMELSSAHLQLEETPRTELMSLPAELKAQRYAHLAQHRRSAREFAPYALDDDVVEQIMNIASMNDKIDVATLLLRAKGHESGIYHGTRLSKAGMFDIEIVKLLVAQRLVASSAMVIVLHSDKSGPLRHLEAGIIGHWLYLLAEARGIACTGIGAYYDDELQTFLQIDGSILYVVALGVKA